MKSGVTLMELLDYVDAAEKRKQDFKVEPGALKVVAVASGLELIIAGTGAFELNDTAHTQLAARLEIPIRYYRRCLDEVPELLAINVNHWLAQEREPRLVRTLDGRVRAYLSARYKRMDNHQLLAALLPVLQEIDGLTIESCHVDEDRLYIKALTQKTEALKVGDLVQYGICISNSEVGLSRLKVEPLIFRLVCQNGMIAQDYGVSRRHTGKVESHLESDLVAEGVYSDETLRADDQVLWLKVQDQVRHMMSDVIFREITSKFRESMQLPLQRGSEALDKAVTRVVEDITKRHALSEDEKGMTLRHLYQGGDFTRFGLVNAVTRMSQDVDSYQRATELERLGYELLLSK